MNQTLVPPFGATLTWVRADGAYLLLRYSELLYNDDKSARGETCICLYLNDQGREVLRTEEDIFLPEQPFYDLPGFGRGPEEIPITIWAALKYTWNKHFRRPK